MADVVESTTLRINVLKETIYELETKIVEYKSLEVKWNKTAAELETTIRNLQATCDIAEEAQRIAEARAVDLQESLRVERIRFDKAIEHEREVDQGLRSKIGLIPRPSTSEGQVVGLPQPIQNRRQPWGSVQSHLQRSAKEAADRLEASYKEKIAAIEQKDNSGRAADTPA